MAQFRNMGPVNQVGAIDPHAREGEHDARGMIARATRRTEMAQSDSKSGARFERLEIDGASYVLKYIDPAHDWIMRATGDVAARPLLVWESGLLDWLPRTIDHAIVGVVRPDAVQAAGGALLMRDVGSWLVPEGDAPLSVAQHRRFLDHMASLHAAFWNWTDTVGLTPMTNRYLEFSPYVVACEVARGVPDAVVTLFEPGWDRFRKRAPGVADAVTSLVENPFPLVKAFEQTPSTFIHGDWKAGNLGSGPDGRTILLDWATPGQGPACADLAWYLAINAARLPEAKETAIQAYRSALAARGVDTEGWWDRQLRLALLGAVVQFGWEKALGDEAELAWWTGQARLGLEMLGREGV